MGGSIGREEHDVRTFYGAKRRLCSLMTYGMIWKSLAAYQKAVDSLILTALGAVRQTFNTIGGRNPDCRRIERVVVEEVNAAVSSCDGLEERHCWGFRCILSPRVGGGHVSGVVTSDLSPMKHVHSLNAIYVPLDS